MTCATPAGPPPGAPDAPGSSRPSPTWPSPGAPSVPAPSAASVSAPSGTVVGFLPQPANTRVPITIKRTVNDRITRTPWLIGRRSSRRALLTQGPPARHARIGPSIEEGRPRSLPQFAGARRDLPLHAAVARDDGERVAPADAARVEDVRAIRRERGRLVLLSAAQHLQAASLHVDRADAVSAAIERDDRELAPVRRDARARVVAALESDPPRARAGLEPDLIHLRRPGAVRGEVERGSVRRPGRLGVDRRIVGHALQVLRRKRQHVDV